MTLRRMTLRDFVLVRDVELELSDGFTVLTGETGAGKSILIDALQFALGARAEALVVREGAPRAEVSAEFELPSALSGWLESAGFDSAETLLLRRTVDLQGKSRGWINGSPATATQLREIGSLLVDIHGQHAWQSLTRPATILDLLDAYADIAPEKLRACWEAWQHAADRLAQAKARQTHLQQERERLTWQISELDRLAPAEQEWGELNATHSRLANAQALIETGERVLDALDADDAGANTRIDRALHDLQSLAHVEPAFQGFSDVLASAQAQIADALHEIRNWQTRLDLDPGRLGEIDTRLSQWIGLSRRFRRPPEELPALLLQWQAELSALDAATDMEALTHDEEQTRTAYLLTAKHITSQRKKAAPELGHAVTQAMQNLGMQGGRFEIVVQPLPDPTARGMDEVEFLVAGHAGSSPRPVAKVASGGELSRIALAIAVTTSELGAAPTLIFDEVDSGVGGAVAETVGRMMKTLGTRRQVMAVTHLPQVAACADHHLVVAKRSGIEGTTSAVTLVNGEHRVAEIGRMLGGERLSSTTLAHARELLGS